MAEEEAKKVEFETPSDPPAAPSPEPVEIPKVVAEEKSVIPHPTEEKSDDSKAVVIVDETKALAVVEKSGEEKSTEGSINRDAVLAQVSTEKRVALIKAWEESEKSKAENKSQKKLSAIGAWENSKKANLEAELKKMEEKLENMKAAYVEKMKNKLAIIHKEAEEKRAMIEAKRGEDLLKAEEMAAKYRATGTGPKKLLGCF